VVLERGETLGRPGERGRSEVLGEGPSWLSDRWSQLSPRRRRVIGVVGALVVAAPTVVIGIERVRDWQTERTLRDEVVVAAELEVLASSTSPAGGSVWFSVVLRNDGHRPVQFVDLRGVAPGLTVTVPAQRLQRLRRVMPLEPGDSAQVTVSARLDCTAGSSATGSAATGSSATAAEDSPSMTAQVTAVPLSGRRRTVDVPVANANLLTDVAATTCRFRPTASGVELSGPVVPS
jgi:hypothetical protein